MGTGPSQHSDDERTYHDTPSSQRHFKNVRPPRGSTHPQSKSKSRPSSKKTVRSSASVKRTQSMKRKKHTGQRSRGSAKKEEKGDSGRGSASASGTGSSSDLELKSSLPTTDILTKSEDRMQKKSKSRRPPSSAPNHFSSSSENESQESCTLCSDSYNYPLPVCGGKKSIQLTKSHPTVVRAYADLASIKSSERREESTSKTTSNNILHSKGFQESKCSLPINSSQKEKNLSVKFELQAKKVDAKKTKSLDVLSSQRDPQPFHPDVFSTTSVKFSITESKPDNQPSKLFITNPSTLHSGNSSSPQGSNSQSIVSNLTQELKEATSMLRRQRSEASSSMDHKTKSPILATSPSLQAFDKIVNGPLKNFLDFSTKIGDDVAKVGFLVKEAFGAQNVILKVASEAKKPSDKELEKLLKPLSDKINEIQSFRESQRRSQYFNHFSAISESILALGWVSVTPAPAPYVKEMCDAGQFYTNRVLKDWKEKGRIHVDWCKMWLNTLSELQAFVKEHHTTGLSWNNRGVEVSKAVVTGSKVGGSVPPPPPPPPPSGLFEDLSAGPERPGASALFAEINKGDEVTRGLKKVTPDMQTHKNTNLRNQAGQFVDVKNTNKSGYSANSSTRPPKFELEGKKWIIENQKNHSGLVVDKTDLHQSVYIFGCEGCTIKVKGKVNNIVLDNCKKTAIIFQDVLSSCEFINCQSVQMQVLGKVPTISVEKTDGCQMYLSEDSLGVEIVSAKSSEMNVLIPSDDDFIEQPIPEQFKTVLSGKKLITTFAESI